MPRSSPSFNRFNRGEWSPQMRGRSDLPSFEASSEFLSNMIPTIQGPATKRSGTRFVAKVPDTTALPIEAEYGTFQLSTSLGAGGLQSIPIGVTDPKVIIVWNMGLAATVDTSVAGDLHLNYGFATSTAQRSVLAADEDNVTTSNSARIMSESNLIQNGYYSGGLITASFAGFGQGSFSLLYNGSFGSAYTYRYVVLGGPGIDAEIATHSSPTSTGSVEFAPFSFDPDCMLFVTTGQTSLGSIQDHCGFSVGAAAGDSIVNAVAAIDSEDGLVNDSDATSYSRQGDCLFLSGVFRASVSSWTTGGANLTYNTVSGSPLPVFVLALKTNGAASIGTFLTETDTITPITGSLESTAQATLAFTCGQTESPPGSRNVIRGAMAIGVFDAGSVQGSDSFFTESNVATVTNVNRCADFNDCLREIDGSAATVASVRVSSVAQNGWSALMSDADVSASFCWFLSFGTSYVPSSRGRLIPFKFSELSVHQLCFRAYAMRVFTNGGIQLEATGAAITGATQANPVVVTAVAHGFENQDDVLISGVQGMTQLNGRYFTVSNATADTFELTGINGTGFGAYTSGGTATKPFEVSTPYGSDELSSIEYAQINDVMYLTQGSHPPMKLSRLGNSNWTLEAADLAWPPFQATNIDEDEFIVSSGETGSVTLTSTGGRFEQGHVGSYLKMESRYETLPEWRAVTAQLDIGNGAGAAFGDGDELWFEGNVYERLDNHGHTNTGTSAPVHTRGTRTDGHWSLLFKHSGAGYVQITAVSSPTRALGTVVKRIPFHCKDPDRAVSSVSNASPPVVTLSGSHNYETGDRVWLDEISGSASVFNGDYYTITKTGAATFSLDDQVASGTGTGGYAVRVDTGDSVNHSTREFRDHDLWAFSAFSDVNGYPKAVTFFEDRMWLAGTDADPVGAWASRTGEYEDFEIHPVEDSGLMVTLATSNPIEWMAQLSSLVVGTAGEEFSSPRDGAPLAADTVHAIRRRSGYGSKRGVLPVAIENTILMVSPGGREIRELTFDLDSGDLSAANIALVAEHLTKGQIQQVAFQSTPSRILSVTLADGSWRGVTYERGEEVVGWFRLVPGGTDVSVQSSAVVPDSQGIRDEIWAVVERTINGSSVRFVEYIAPLWDEDNAIVDAYFVDAGLTYSGSPVSNVTGLEHLEGEAVAVLADGVPVTGRSVSGGTLDSALPSAASEIHVGLAFSGELLTQKIESGAADGTAQGKIQRIREVILILDQTGTGLQYGPSLTGDMDTYEVGEGQLFSGATGPLLWPSGYERGAQVAFRHSTPLPCSIQAVLPKMTTEDQ